MEKDKVLIKNFGMSLLTLYVQTESVFLFFFVLVLSAEIDTFYIIRHRNEYILTTLKPLKRKLKRTAWCKHFLKVDLTAWTGHNILIITSWTSKKTKKMTVDFQTTRNKANKRKEVEDYKYLDFHLGNRLDCRHYTDFVCKKGQSRLYFLRKPSPSVFAAACCVCSISLLQMVKSDL